MDLQALVKKFMSFGIIGAILTFVSLASNYVCLKYFNFPLIPTYVGVYAVTIFISFYFNSKYTFKNELTLQNTVKYYSIYLSSMCIGAVLLYVFDKTLPFENWVFPFLALPFTLSFNFLMSSKYLSSSEAIR
jgi:putative flippase GtrA